MKKIFTLILICWYFTVHGQQKQLIQDKWDTYTHPTSDNYFYHHFKSYISDDMLNLEAFPNNTSKIIIEFNLNNLNYIENIRTNTSDVNLNNTIIKAFTEISFDQIKINQASLAHNYSMQIATVEQGKPVLKCSSSILHEIPPILEGCEKNKLFSDYTKCLSSSLQYYLETSIDSTKIEDINTTESIKILASLMINKQGKIEIQNINSVDSTLKSEAKKIFEHFNFRIRPAIINGIVDDYSIIISTASDNIRIPPSATYFSDASVENNLSKHFLKEIPNDVLALAKFNIKQKNITISFNTNSKNEPIQIQTNSNNEVLDEALIQAFKKIPIHNLNLPKNNILNSYIIQVIAFEDNKKIIKCSYPKVFETLPILSGCEKSKNILSLKNCNQNAVSRQVSLNYNLNTARNLNLIGKIKIFALFKINKNGQISDIKVRAPHKNLEEETIRVLKKIKVVKPGSQYGIPVGVKYSLPIVFSIDDSKKQIEYKKPTFRY